MIDHNKKQSMNIQGQVKSFKLNDYEIYISSISEKQFAIQVIDSRLKIQFAQSQLILENIGTCTLIIALQASRKDISVTANYKKQTEFDRLQLKVTVQSQFIQTIEESIFIKKLRNIDQMQMLQIKIKNLTSNWKEINEKREHVDGDACSFELKEQSFDNNINYDVLQTIHLKKGKYLLTFSFLAKVIRQRMYLYLNNGQTIIHKSCYFVKSTKYFIPFTIRTVYAVTEQQKDVSFKTFYATKYPVVLRNRIITAQRL